MKRFLLPFFILLVCQWVFVDSGLSDESKVLRVRDGKIITFAVMIADVKKADFVFIGEVHDISEHHRDELAIIRAFHELEAPTAVGLEMFRADSQGVLDSWVRGKLSVKQFLPEYYDNWREPWPLYRDIFQYARANAMFLHVGTSGRHPAHDMASGSDRTKQIHSVYFPSMTRSRHRP